ncbi:MAG: hydrogenase maturation protease [Bryobacteraceae bacterium]
MSRRIGVIGLGNPDRGDDAVGVLVVRSLVGRMPSDVALVEDGDPLSVLEEWEKFDAVILVDAVRSGSPAGTVQVFDGRRLPSTVRAGLVSTHGLGVRDVIGLGEALGTLPEIVRVVGIEAAEFEPGAALAPEVVRAVAEAVEVVREQIVLIGHE